MSNVLIDNEVKILDAFVSFAKQEGYKASVAGLTIIIKDVTNPNNNFRIERQDNYYLVHTICVSAQDYEYTARCTVYLLLAQYNQLNASATHLHLNFKVNL